MRIIGITGPSGAGKGELCNCLSKHGVPCINADNVYHQLLNPPSPCIDALVEHFGRGILNGNGFVDRHALAEIVFAPGNEAEHEELNRITHSFVAEKLQLLINEYSSASCRAVALDVPLLFESKLDMICDIKVSVLANRAIRTERIMQRDNLNYSAATARIAAQPSDEFYIERSDLVFYNNSDIVALSGFVSEILALLPKEDNI